MVTETKNYIQAEAIEIDTNSGFKETVNVETNEQLINIQYEGGEILNVEGPINYGRKTYLLITYLQSGKKIKNYQQIHCMEIDTNTGFKDTVNVEMNEQLIKLQNDGNNLIEIKGPVIDGRKTYVLIRYEVEVKND